MTTLRLEVLLEKLKRVFETNSYATENDMF